MYDVLYSLSLKNSTGHLLNYLNYHSIRGYCIFRQSLNGTGLRILAYCIMLNCNFSCPRNRTWTKTNGLATILHLTEGTYVVLYSILNVILVPFILSV